jgi:hypothetical protein
MSRGQPRVEAALKAEDAVQGWLVTSLRFGDEIPLLEDNALACVSERNAPTHLTYYRGVA